MATYGAEAIVLRKSNFGEADQVVTLLSKYKGKISAVAKGVRRMGSRKGGNLDIFNLVKLHLAEGKNLDIITEVDLVSAWPGVKVDLDKVAVAFQIAELTNEFSTEHQENQNLFILTKETLEFLEIGVKNEQILQIYQVKLLSTLGFQPQLASCVICGKALPLEGLALSPELGGVVGPEEREKDQFSWGISAASLKVIRFFTEAAVADCLKLKVPVEVARETGQSLQYYLEYILEKELKAPKLSRDIRSLRTN